jgi:hypothetical protein
MALTALTTLTHGKEDGTRVVVPEGEKVPQGLFTKEQLEELKENGAIGEPPPSPSEVAASDEENANLKEQVAKLQEELAAARAPKK